MINYANCILLLLYINIFDERKKEKKTRQGKKEQTSQIQITYRIGVYSSIQKKNASITYWYNDIAIISANKNKTECQISLNRCYGSAPNHPSKYMLLDTKLTRFDRSIS